MTTTEAEDFESFEFEPEPDAGKGQVITRGELIRWSGLSTSHIATLLREGMPVVSRGTKRQGYKINSAAWLSWYVARKVAEATGGGDADGATFTQTKIANMESQRRLRELQIAEKEGELVPICDVESWAAEQHASVKSRLLAIHTTVPDLSEEQREAIHHAVIDALSELSGYVHDAPESEEEDAAGEWEQVDS